VWSTALPEENEYIKDVYGHIAKGSLVNFISQVGFSLSAMLTSIIVARLLGPEEYGIFSILSSLQSLIILLASLNISVAVTKFLSEYRVTDFEKSVRYFNIAGLMTISASVIVCILLFVLSGFITVLYRYTISPFLIRVTIVPVLISPLILFLYSVFRGYQKIKLHAYLQIITSITRLSILVSLTLLFGLIGLLIGIILEAALFLVIQVISLRRTIPTLFSFRLSFKFLKRDEILSIFKFTIPIFIPLVAITFANWFTSTLLALNKGYTEIAFFAIAFTLSQIITYVPRALSIPLLPSISEVATTSSDKVNLISNKAVTFVTNLGFLIALLLSVFPFYIVEILYGSIYANTITYMILIIGSIGFFLQSTITPTIDVLFATGKTKAYCIISLVNVSFLIIFSFFLIPIAGGIGLSLSYLLSTIVYVVLIRSYFLKLKQKIVWYPIQMTVLLFFLSFFVFWIFSTFGLLITSISAAFIFASAFIVIFFKLKKTGVLGLFLSLFSKKNSNK